MGKCLMRSRGRVRADQKGDSDDDDDGTEVRTLEVSMRAMIGMEGERELGQGRQAVVQGCCKCRQM